ncbi:hypothetical protein LSAT2_017366 [Lamellibrachia satsuma]|nr:hypothetical protein LSAT2_017366 [Lamellibrachia satsuma]
MFQPLTLLHPTDNCRRYNSSSSRRPLRRHRQPRYSWRHRNQNLFRHRLVEEQKEADKSLKATLKNEAHQAVAKQLF